jgi:hypothetical protein
VPSSGDIAPALDVDDFKALARASGYAYGAKRGLIREAWPAAEEVMNARELRVVILIIALVALIATLGAVGCTKTSPYSPLGKTVGMELPIESLRLELYGFVDRFSGSVEDHADKIISATDDPEIRRNARLWKMNAIPAIQKAAFQFDPLAGYVDAWVLTKQMLQYFEEGHGKDLFGELQHIAIEASRMTVEEIEANFKLAADIDEDVGGGETRKDVNDFVAEHPLDNLLFVRYSTAGLLAQLTKDKSRGTFAAMGRLEMSLGDMTDRMNIYAAHLPDQARWQAELAIDDFLGSPEFEEGYGKLDEMKASIDLTAANVAGVSETIDAQVVGALEIVPEERAIIFAEVDRQRLETIEVVRAERELILAAIREERIAVFEDVQRERVAVMQDMEALVLRGIDESKSRAEDLIDGVLWRMTVLGAIALAMLLAFGLLALWIFRPVRT